MGRIAGARVGHRHRPARLATVALFFLSGLALGVWVVAIPAVQQRTGVDHRTLGNVLLLLGLGALAGMSAAGPLIGRIGSRAVAAGSGLVVVVAVNLPGLATDGWELGAALAVFGIGQGALDVAMNDQAVSVERAYGRPIMANFHAFFSVGGAVGGVLGAGLQGMGLSAHWLLGVGAVSCTVLLATACPWLLASGGEAVESHVAATVTGRDRTVTIVLLAGLAFCMLLAEGAANDWSTLHAVEHLHLPESSASLAYGTFAAAMTIGRFSADAVARRVGPVAMVRGGSVLATVGMLVVVVSPVFPLTLVGWALFGIGLSGIVPQIFTAAGNLGGANQAVVISRVVGAGYVALLAGPAVIGWVSQAVGLTLALVLPVLCCVLGVVLAGRVGVRG